MKNTLIFAAFAEVATGLGLLIVPSLVGQLLLGEQFAGDNTSSARRWHRPDCFGDRLLARSATGRHVDVQRSRHLVPCLSRFRRWFDRRPSVAGCRRSPDPDCALGSRPHANATGFALRSDASCEPPTLLVRACEVIERSRRLLRCMTSGYGPSRQVAFFGPTVANGRDPMQARRAG